MIREFFSSRLMDFNWIDRQKVKILMDMFDFHVFIRISGDE